MPQIEGWLDARKIERGLYNLVLNGCQAAGQGTGSPEVGVALLEDDASIFFLITDNGPGVPEAIRESLFQPFVSVGKASGVGLGLTLAEKIAQEQGRLGVVVPGLSAPHKNKFGEDYKPDPQSY